MYEQTLLLNDLKYGFTLCGGYDDAERKIACFGDENTLGYPPAPPICLMKIAPLSAKFSDTLTHRDFLGSVLALGIKRETIGDIIIADNEGYLFCLENISRFLADNLTKVRHTSVCCEICDSLPDRALPHPTEKSFIVSSLRLDGIISAVYNLSRSKSSALIDGEKVFLNGKLITGNSAPVKEDDIVSVRGYGRFKFKEISGTTRKGRLGIICFVY